MMEDEEGVHRNKEKERKDEKEKVRGQQRRKGEVG